MTSLLINGTDLELEFGLGVAELPDVLSQAPSIVEFVQHPGMAGGILAGPATVGPRRVKIRLTVGIGLTLAQSRQQLRDLANICGQGTGQIVTIQTIDRADVMAYGRLETFEAVPYQPQVIQPIMDVTLTFILPGVYWRETSALPYGVGTTLTQLPVWNAPCSPIWEIMGAVDQPILTITDWRGEPVSASTFGITLGPDDFVRVYSDAMRMTIWQSILGVLTQNDGLLVDGLFPQPLEGSGYLGHFPMAKVSGGSARAIYPRMAA